MSRDTLQRCVGGRKQSIQGGPSRTRLQVLTGLPTVECKGAEVEMVGSPPGESNSCEISQDMVQHLVRPMTAYDPSGV
jgi:hypothetical protein